MLHRDSISTPFFVCGSLGLTVVITMNTILFFRILDSDFFGQPHPFFSLSKESLRCESNILRESSFHPVSKDVGHVLQSFFDDDNDDWVLMSPEEACGNKKTD
jgi:hypothetical protein